MRCTPIILDRLDAALRLQGVELRRSALLQTAAAAYGYRNTETFSTADRSGRLTPAAAIPIGRVRLGEVDLVVLRDPVADAPYAIDVSFVEGPVQDERRERFGPSPYGGLLDLGGIGDDPALANGPGDDARRDASSDAGSRAVDTLAAIAAATVRHHGVPTGFYHLLTIRDGDVVDEVIKADDDDDARVKGIAIAADRFRIERHRDADDDDDVEAETDSFSVEPIPYPEAAALVGDALETLRREGMAQDHPARIALLAAVDALRPKATA